jgi:hypothetical protein
MAVSNPLDGPVPVAVSTCHHPNRPTAPDSVWDWQAYSTWRSVVWDLISDTVDDRVRSAFMKSPPEYVVGDDLSWLDDIIRSVQGFEVASKSLLADRLGQRFKALRAFHGTRTSDVAGFYRNGLLPLDPGTIHAQARAIFLSGAFPELRAVDIETAIQAVGSDLRAHRVFFEANEEVLVAQCGHYLLYGSEYLTAIAAHLSGHRDYRQVLKSRGEPTLFICDVPLPLIDGHALLEFAGTALANVFQELLDGEDYAPERWRGAGFCIKQPLLPEYIVDHYHPVVSRDPFCRVA